MPVILANQEAEINVQNSLCDPISKNPITEIGLVVWFKVKDLSSNPSATKKKIIKSQALWFQAHCMYIYNIT
jgi:hypothetical protein